MTMNTTEKQIISNHMSAMAKKRWAKTTPEERVANAERLNKAKKARKEELSP